MKRSQLSGKNLSYHKKSFVLLILAAAVSTAILAGAIFLGDSVKSTLITLGQEKTGSFEYAAIPHSFNSLYSEIENNNSFVSVLKIKERSVSNSSGLNIENVNVFAVGQDFIKSFANNKKQYKDDFRIEEGKIIINEHLADTLSVKAGDDLLLSFSSFSALSPSFVFYLEEESRNTISLEIQEVISNRGVGRFSLSISQSAENLIYVNLNYWRNKFNIGKRVNLHLIKNTNSEITKAEVEKNISLADIGLNIKKYSSDYNLLSSDSLFLSAKLIDTIKIQFPEIVTVYSYFINNALSSGKSSPFHFIIALPIQFLIENSNMQLEENQIIISNWLADDLELSKGSRIDLNYYVITETGELSEKNSKYEISAIWGQSRFSDYDNLIPPFPGLAGKESCLDWDPGIPVDLNQVRPVDEDFWNTWGLSPKIIMSYKDASAAWGSEKASATSILIPSFYNKTEIENLILNSLSLEEKGMQLINLKSQAEAASEHGINFTELFLGLSFLLIISVLLVLVFIMQIFYQSRSGEFATMQAMGYSAKQLKRIVYKEITFITIPGAVAGILIGSLYCVLLLQGLKTIWFEAARLDTIIFSFPIQSILLSAGISILLNMGVGVMVARKILKASISGIKSSMEKSITQSKRTFPLAALFSALLALSLIAVMLLQKVINSDVIFFFICGAIILLLFISLSFLLLKRGKRFSQTKKPFSKKLFNITNIKTKRKQNIAIFLCALLSVFMIISIGANKHLLDEQSPSLDEGTGGFTLLIETTEPQNPQHRNWQELWNLKESFIVPIRLQRGDEASCLNLNQIRTPQILGINPAELSGRFQFAEFISEEFTNWSVLKTDLGLNKISVVADSAVLSWSIGLKVGDSLQIIAEDGTEYDLVFTAALTNSVFQGSILISEENFLKLFPSNRGYQHFLTQLQAPENLEQQTAKLKRILRPSGVSIKNTKSILIEYYSVENTYITIFYQLGLLSLIFGIIGISILIVRKVFDEKEDILFQKAIGFQNRQISKRLFLENFAITGAGIIGGVISAVIALWPKFSADKKLLTEYPLTTLILLLGSAALCLYLFAWGAVRKMGK